ncbi:hypothetical protein [Vitiosangium sp. GDMCC 1.1324]|uniref:hypothetical protein n=1 Tax=Vitiosangium sp. (strain GDMCC 1.1324) TaxID=2138576 RepID=UPI000D33A9A5|nr:hypothetical protein [Vitiosangium sp. GDMCC 1.1324]PTL79062.1 hypothetical protein DAT35_36225 [Vitiosangium sp. GDMCC 1.1324]
MLRKTALLCTLLLGACDAAPSSAPNIVSIEPEEVMSGEASTITLELDAPLPMKVDYGKRTATVLMPTVLIGGQKVTVTALEQDGRLQATVPSDLAAGLQEVRLELEDGNESVRAQGLTVLPVPPALETLNGDGDPGDGTASEPPSDPTPGSGSECPQQPGDGGRQLQVTGLRIEPIPDQVRGVPFIVTLRAEGPDAARFAGRVQLSSSKGHVSPNLSDPFSKGVRQERVVLDKQSGNVVLTVRVGKDIVAQSNPFKVWVK